MPVGFPLVYAAIPLFPPFITLTAVTIPGVSLISPPYAIGVLCAMGVLGVYAVTMLLVPPRMRAPTLFPLLGWIGAGVLAAALGFNPTGGLLFIGILGLALVWHLTLLRYYGDPGVPRAIFTSYLLTGGLAALAAVVMVLLRRPADQYDIGHGRAIGTFILPGELAGYLIIFLPICLAVARLSRDRLLRSLAIGGGIAGAVAMLLSFSRAGWVGLAAAIAFYALVSPRVRRYAPLILLAGVGAVLAVFNAHHNPSENYTRLSIWQAGLSIVRRFPLTGVGPFDFARVYPLVRLPDGDATAFHAHDTVLTFFAETGIVGVLAMFYAWWRFAQVLAERVRRAPRVHVQLALAVAAGLAGTWVQGLIDTVSVVIFGLWIPMMGLALAAAEHGLGEES